MLRFMLDDLYGKERFCQDQPEPQAVWLGAVTGWRPVKPPAMPEPTSLLNSRGQNTRSTASMVQRVFTYNFPGQSHRGLAIMSRARLTFPVRYKARDAGGWNAVAHVPAATKATPFSSAYVDRPSTSPSVSSSSARLSCSIGTR